MARGDGGGPLGPERLGRYQLLRKIAVGGMAEIYLARVSGAGGFEKNVVVKRILPQLAESDEFFTMFLDEARIAATLQHPNVVHIYDAGQEDSEYFIAMEHLDGADLHTVRRVLGERGESMPLLHAMFIVSAVAAGLHYAHEKVGLDGAPLHIVHRDVTPQNVFLTREGGVKLVDFGIAKAANRSSTTTYGTLKGKLAYMSPEQCRAEPVDRRADIYSLGVLLYELTCGHRPHRGKSEYELLREIVEGAVPPPSLSMPHYPAELEAIVMRALAPDPAARHPHALALEQDLERFARRHALVGSTLALAEFLAPVLDAAEERAQARQRRRVSSVPPPIIEERPETMATFVGHRLGRSNTPTPSPAHQGNVVMKPVALVARAPARAPAPAGTATAGGLDDALLDVRLRPGRAVPLVLVSLLLAGGGTAATIYYHGSSPAASAGPEQAGLAAEAVVGSSRPERGVVHVTSDPPGAAVWLSLGPTPVVSGPVAVGREHRIRVEHDGYQTRELAAAAGDSVAAELTAARSEAILREPAALPGPGAHGGSTDAHIRVSSRPPAATVWLLVGVTPARIPVATGRPVELRIARDDYLPAFVEVEPARFGPDGEVRLSATLRPGQRD